MYIIQALYLTPRKKCMFCTLYREQLEMKVAYTGYYITRVLNLGFALFVHNVKRFLSDV